MKNISILENCYGCGVCIEVCPKKIIRLDENTEGFYSPVVFDEKKCIECGLCLDVCAFNHSEISLIPNFIKSYAGWSKNDNTRLMCSSGGIGYEIGKQCIEKGYKACGVRYDAEKQRAEHFVATSAADFIQSIGSKYIPSFTSTGFSEINKKDKFFITGTPCQIDSIRRFIRKFKIEQNFILLDFFCHGTPSLLLWDKYLEDIQPKIGKILSASWRNKTTGWHDSWSMTLKGNKANYSSRRSQGDLFYKFFLGNYCLNECCYKKCKYKKSSSAADIRIGDLWGKAYSDDFKGTSSIIVLTKIGMEVLNELGRTTCEIHEKSVDLVSEGQMIKSPARPLITDCIIKILHSKWSLNQIYRMIVLPYYTFIKLPINFILKLKRKFAH